ncbi:MAG: cyclic nucleotide-binding domain-containing protein [Anaeromyxobacter sp.]
MVSAMTVAEALRSSTLFKDFSDVGIQLFARIAQEKAFPAGSPLFVESMVGESLFIVKAGSVRVVQKSDGGERELTVLGPGEHLGELGILARSVRLVSAVAASQTEVVELAHRDFLALQATKPQACLKLALAIAADLAARMGEARELVQRAALKPQGG